MADGFQKLILMGNLGKDPEMKYLPSGIPVTEFSVAVGRSRKNPEGGDRIQETEWFTCKAFDKTGEVINQYFAKGSKILVEGRLQTRSWADKNTSEKKYRTEVVVERVNFVDSKANGEPKEPKGVPEHDTGIDQMDF